MSSHRRHHGHHRGCSPLCTSVRHELLDLSNHLRQERLYVQHEKVQVRIQVTFHLVFVMHLSDLQGLVFVHFQLQDILEQTIFQDAYKHLGHQEVILLDGIVSYCNW